MTIVKWAPFAELDSVERRMRRMAAEFGFAPGFVPAADVYETDEEFVVELEVPGFDERELTIEVTDHTLAIKGEREKTEEKKTKEFALHERLERKFERRFVLPPDAATDEIHATFGNGVLEVHTPRVAMTKPKAVTITKA
jgi:HSP20 family protein